MTRARGLKELLTRMTECVQCRQRRDTNDDASSAREHGESRDRARRGTGRTGDRRRGDRALSALLPLAARAEGADLRGGGTALAAPGTGIATPAPASIPRAGRTRIRSRRSSSRSGTGRRRSPGNPKTSAISTWSRTSILCARISSWVRGSKPQPLTRRRTAGTSKPRTAV